MNSAAALSLLLLAGLTNASIGDSPIVKTCAEDQPDVTACRQRALQDLVVMLAAGIPSIGADPVDPLEDLPSIDWKGNAHGVSIRFQLSKPRITGHSGAIVDSLQVDQENNKINIVAHTPGEFVLEGVYNIEGNVLSVPLKGKGNFKSVMVGSGSDVTFQGHPVKGQDGHTYLQLDSVTVNMSYGKSNYDFGGLFGDFTPLTDAGNLFINKVAAPVVEREMQPALNEWLGSIYLQRAQAVFSKVPYETLFPKTQG